MASFFSRRPNTYCAFCKTPRRIPTKKRVGFYNFVMSMLFGAVMTFIVFQEFDPRGILFVILGLVVSEYFIQMRWRMSIMCKSCGFDPVVYLKNPTMAAEKVKSFMDMKKQDSQYLLARPLNLPSITPERLQEIQASQKKSEKTSGRFLSRSM